MAVMTIPQIQNTFKSKGVNLSEEEANLIGPTIAMFKEPDGTTNWTGVQSALVKQGYSQTAVDAFIDQYKMFETQAQDPRLPMPPTGPQVYGPQTQFIAQNEALVNAERQTQNQNPYALPQGATPYTPPADPLADKSDEELAVMAARGAFGNGDARKAALGARYDKVQALVNKQVQGQGQGQGQGRDTTGGTDYTAAGGARNAVAQASAEVWANSTAGKTIAQSQLPWYQAVRGEREYDPAWGKKEAFERDKAAYNANKGGGGSIPGGPVQPVTPQITGQEPSKADPTATSAAPVQQQQGGGNSNQLQTWITRQILGNNRQGYISDRDIRNTKGKLLDRGYSDADAEAALQQFLDYYGGQGRYVRQPTSVGFNREGTGSTIGNAGTWQEGIFGSNEKAPLPAPGSDEPQAIPPGTQMPNATNLPGAPGGPPGGLRPGPEITPAEQPVDWAGNAAKKDRAHQAALAEAHAGGEASRAAAAENTATSRAARDERQATTQAATEQSKADETAMRAQIDQLYIESGLDTGVQTNSAKARELQVAMNEYRKRFNKGYNPATLATQGFSKGGYVTRPKRSIISAVTQYRHGV
jgi:hypothetical protein